MQWIASFVYTTFLFAWVLLFAIFFNVASLFVPLRTRNALARCWANVILGGLKYICRLDYRVEGRGNLPPGGHVALWKHSSSWETFAMVTVCPPQVWVLKRELLWLPFFGWALALARPVAVDRRNGRSAAMKSLLAQGKSRLDDGISIIVFPEGTRIAPGERGTYHVGGALLATHTGYPVLPIAHNAGTLWPKNGFLKYPGRVQITIGAPIAVAGRSAKEVLAETERWIETTVAALPPARLTPTNRDT